MNDLTLILADHLPSLDNHRSSALSGGTDARAVRPPSTAPAEAAV